MIKLIIQIPCFNEELTLAKTIAQLPKTIRGIDVIETLVIDDGSKDETIAVAQRAGVTHVVSHVRNQGLARAFMTGIHAALARGATIIVNTDADNQYHADDIEKLVGPILNGSADIVIGSRPISVTKEFSFTKRCLQRLGSWVVRLASSTDVPDAPSGFRAFSRKAASELNVFSDYTYTLETIIQAGQKNMAISHVPVRTNPSERPSRLVRSSLSYVLKSAVTIIRIFMTYRPALFFGAPACASVVLAAALMLRFLYYYFTRDQSGHVQSFVLAAVLGTVGMTLAIFAMLADLISVNRKLLEKLDWQQRQLIEGDTAAPTSAPMKRAS